MADNRRHMDDEPRRHERDWSDRAGAEVRPWFGDRDNRASRWEGPREEHEHTGYSAATGSYRTDDRGYHDRFRQREDAYPYRQSPGAEVEQREPNGRQPWARERGGYWRQYQGQRAPFAGRGPKDYKRSDDRVREEICDCMTDDPLLDASEIVVQVSNGEVTLSGSVSSREQKRRAEDVAECVSGVTDVTNQLRIAREANGHSHTASQPVSQANGTETPSKSTSGTSS